MLPSAYYIVSCFPHVSVFIYLKIWQFNQIMMSQETDAVDISSNTRSSLVHCIVGYGIHCSVCKLHI